MSAAGRVVEVDADRLPGWVERFAVRHGPVRTRWEGGGHQQVVVEADDGARADIAVPYRPVPDPAADHPEAINPDAVGPNQDLLEADDPIATLVAHVLTVRTIGVLLVRRGGWAAAVVAGGTVLERATGGGYVQGRTKAGGWSQQRYARRRGHQTQQVWDRAADGAAGVLLPHRDALDTLVTGGDRSGVAAVLEDARLAGLAGLVESRFLAVGDPDRAVLTDALSRLSSVVITLNELA